MIKKVTLVAKDGRLNTRSSSPRYPETLFKRNNKRMKKGIHRKPRKQERRQRVRDFPQILEDDRGENCSLITEEKRGSNKEAVKFHRTTQKVRNGRRQVLPIRQGRVKNF